MVRVGNILILVLALCLSFGVSAASNELYDDENNLSLAKQGHSELLYLIWGSVYLTADFPNTDATSVDAFMQEGINVFKTRFGIIKAPPYIQRRMDKLLNDIRSHTPDRRISKCARVYAVPIAYETALSNNCDIFVFKEVYAHYTDAEIRAIIAHEVAHSSRADNIKRFGHYVKAGVVLTERYNRALQDDELNADRLGVQILNASGFSGNDALSSVFKMNAIRNGELPKKSAKDYSESHPSAYDRMMAIQQTMKF